MNSLFETKCVIYLILGAFLLVGYLVYVNLNSEKDIVLNKLYFEINIENMDSG